MPFQPKKKSSPKSRPARRRNSPLRRPQSRTDTGSGRLDLRSPEKLQKVLADAGLGSRRLMESAIAAGRVNVDGCVATLGMRVGRGARIRFDDRPVQFFALDAGLPRVLIYYKPVGEVSTLRDPQGRPTVFGRLPKVRNARWVQIGRLDLNTSGLMVFTTSGTLANRLMHPSGEIEREYAVRILGELSPEQRGRLLAGVLLEDGQAKFGSLEAAGGSGANRWYRVVIREGRNREVRRMFEAVGLGVSRLIRTRYGPFTLPATLHRGKWLELAPDSVRKALRALE